MTLNEINKQLLETTEKELLRKSLLSRLSSVESGITEKESLVKAYRNQLDKEYRDYQRLEGSGIVSLFHQVLGNKEKQLEKERQEWLAAQLKFQQAESQLSFLAGEKESLNKQLSDLGDVGKVYADLYQQKEALLISLNDERARNLIVLTTELADTRSKLRESKEAFEAGENTLAELKIMISELEDAKGWGSWDMFGGGVISSSFKYSHMDRARDAMHRAQASLVRLNHELADIGIAEQEFYSPDGLTRFTDMFFDNLITDWIVQSGINRSLDNGHEFYQRVYELVCTIGLKVKQLKEKEQAVDMAYKKLLETAA